MTDKTTAAGSGDDVREGFFARLIRESNQIKTWRHVRTLAPASMTEVPHE